MDFVAIDVETVNADLSTYLPNRHSQLPRWPVGGYVAEPD